MINFYDIKTVFFMENNKPSEKYDYAIGVNKDTYLHTDYIEPHIKHMLDMRGKYRLLNSGKLPEDTILEFEPLCPEFVSNRRHLESFYKITFVSKIAFNEYRTILILGLFIDNPDSNPPDMYLFDILKSLSNKIPIDESVFEALEPHQ